MNIDRPWNIQSQVHCIFVQSKNDLIYISQSIYYHSNIAHCVKKKTLMFFPGIVTLSFKGPLGPSYKQRERKSQDLYFVS